MLFHILTHAFPPVQSLHSLLGLGNTQMTTVRAVMHFMQALLSQIVRIRYDQSIIVPPEALLLMALAVPIRSQLVKPT